MEMWLTNLMQFKTRPEKCFRSPAGELKYYSRLGVWLACNGGPKSTDIAIRRNMQYGICNPAANVVELSIIEKIIIF